METLLDCVPAGSLILDPFAGSSTTLAAALRTGRRAIGFELSADYCRTSRRRLQEEAARLTTSRSRAAA